MTIINVFYSFKLSISAISMPTDLVNKHDLRSDS